MPTTTIHPPAAVIFDMDGLLLDTEVVYGKTWCQAAAAMNVRMTDADYLLYAGRRTEDCEADLMATYGPEFCLTTFFRKQDEFYEAHRQTHGVAVKNGVDELLDLLDAHGIPTGVATSTARHIALDYLGERAARFTAITTGDEVTHGKPAPDIFLLAAQRLGVPAEHCLVLEDASPGIEAACAAGMQVIMVPDLKPPSAQDAERVTLVCASLLEVRDLLQRQLEQRAAAVRRQTNLER